MDERFSTQLRAEAHGIWEGIFANPFLAELREGSLPLEKFRYYLAQDYLYLEGFARAVALALAKAPDSRNLALLSRRITTPVERPLHRKLMALLRLSVDEVEKIGHAPTNLAYVNHMISPNTPKDTDGRREDSGRVGEGATGEMAGLHWGRLEVGGRSSVAA